MSKENYPSKDVIYDFLDFILLKKREKSMDSYISIKNAINIFSIPFPRITLKKGTKLYRGRLNIPGLEYFEKITDIGPRVDFSGITQFGRANEPLQSVFYCSDNIFPAFFETSKIAREKSNIDRETMTIGIWELSENLLLAQIISNKQIEGLNVTLDGLQNNFEDLIHIFKNPKTELHLKVLELFSLEFTRDAKEDPSNYLISCAFANYLFDSIGYDTFYKKNMKVDGIIYPSVAHREEGMNLALKYDVIDSQKVILKNVVKQTMEKTSENEFTETSTIECQSVDIHTNRIYW